jgi:4-hydroxy-tetrahydrodipicolinate synthase
MSSSALERQSRLAGVIAAMLTPMTDRGTRVDPEAAGRLTTWLVEKGVHGLYIAGTTGEGLYLSPEEHRDLVRAVVKAAKGTVPVVAHVGALTTAQAVGLARQAAQAGATAVAAIPPPYYSLSREELLTYFTAIAQAAAPLSLYLYNIPSHARNELPPSFAADLRRAIPSIAGIKDSSGAAGRIPDLVKTLGPSCDVVCGNDDKILQAFQAGAAGIVASGASVFPELYLGLHTAWKAGRVAEAEETQRQIVAMQKALGNGARLGWYKYVLAQRGVPVGGVRGPLADATLAEQEAIRKSLKAMKLL